jgi:hypothetical protein
MKNKIIGRIKNIRYDPDSRELEAVILFLDEKFKKKLLRDLALSGDITFDGKNVIFNHGDEDAKL